MRTSNSTPSTCAARKRSRSRSPRSPPPAPAPSNWPGSQPTDIDVIVPHQANVRIIDAAADRLGIPKERAFTNIQKFGNTSAASCAIALDECHRTGVIKPGNHVLIVAFGAGFTWAASVVKW